MKTELKKEILALENEVMYLKKLKEIQKILLNTGAYSTHNMEVQMTKFDNNKVPDWEREIITNMWNVSTKLSHKFLKQVDILTKKIKEDLENERV